MPDMRAPNEWPIKAAGGLRSKRPTSSAHIPEKLPCEGVAAPRTGAVSDYERAWRDLKGSRCDLVAVQLAFLGHALERLVGTLDTVLVILAIGRQQFHDL